ncbi:MAG: VIT1/CCC1 transporter family protein [Saprospiraceae bacterium]|nr:VIT1/CCC1 transporter family protein [Saprospiraceae bacterium]
MTKALSFWKPLIRERAVLNPVDRISEVIFGLIMALTFTGTVSVTGGDRQEISELLWAALGCNLAWGLVDAIMYVMGELLERGHAVKMLHRVTNAANADAARAALTTEMPPLLARLLSQEALDRLVVQLNQLPPAPNKSLLTWRDIRNALQVFILVFLSTFPVVLPFVFLREVQPAVRMSNGIAIGMLFVAGCLLGRYAGFRPVATAFTYTAIGVVLVVLTILLGG